MPAAFNIVEHYRLGARTTFVNKPLAVNSFTNVAYGAAGRMTSVGFCGSQRTSLRLYTLEFR